MLRFRETADDRNVEVAVLLVLHAAVYDSPLLADARPADDGDQNPLRHRPSPPYARPSLFVSSLSSHLEAPSRARGYRLPVWDPLPDQSRVLRPEHSGPGCPSTESDAVLAKDTLLERENCRRVATPRRHFGSPAR